MVKADTKRVAWFLNLQRVMHFAKYFIAPIKVSRFGRSPAAYGAGGTPRGVRANQNDANGRGRSSLGGVAGFPKARRPFAPADSPGARTTLRLGTQVASELSRGSSGWRARETPPLVSRRGQILEDYVRAGLAATPGQLISGARYEPSRDPGAMPTSSQTSVPLAATQLRSLAPAFPTTDLHRVPDPTIAEVAETRRAENPALPAEQSSSTDAAADDDPSPSANREGSDRPQSGKSAASTIHIDGSVLGRWAVQYLERALGRPATGMTGVDPRATIARSRVAPF